MSSQLIGSDFTGGALLPHYVNGRLLLAEDLATGQSSLVARDARIGQAAGTGIVRGLWVTAGATTLTVPTGSAISPSGRPVVVPTTMTLPLTLPAAPATGNPATFRCCGAGSGGPTSGIAAGGYLLTARPADRQQGRTPLAPPPGGTMSPGCTAQWTAEGVEIRAIALPAPTAVAGLAVTAGNRRNLLAHWCFGTEQLAGFPRDPFTFDPAYSGFDRLDPADLTDLDVPLAVFRWDGQRVVDLDNWSARRRITAPDPVSSPWSGALADRRVADGQARFLQFQGQIDQLVADGVARDAQVRSTFGLLPPVGFLPAVRDTGTLARSPWSGFVPDTFLGSLAVFGGTIEWDLASFALRQSWHGAAVSTDNLLPSGSPMPGEPPLTWYYVQENLDAIDQAPAGKAPGLYVVFMTHFGWQLYYDRRGDLRSGETP